MKFYNDVARLVAERRPDRILCGYAYSSFLYPPAGAMEPLHPNLRIVIAFDPGYGVGILRPGVREEWERVVKYWASVSKNVFYYDSPGELEQEHGQSVLSGAPNPAGIVIDSFIFPRLKQYGVKGVYLYGTRAWGHGGPLNYMLARLTWDPGANPETLFEEFCDRAYGKGADSIKRLYRLVDGDMEVHCADNPKAGYVVTVEMARDVYAKRYADIEALYLRAKAAAESDPEPVRQRVEMLGKNLVFLNWHLRRRGLLKDDPSSSLYRTDEQMEKLYTAEDGNYAVLPRRTNWAEWLVRYPKVAAAPAGQDVVPLPVEWRFQVDPENKGERMGWHGEHFDDSAWGKIRTNAFWEDQGYGAPTYPAKGGYNGYAWYRLSKVVAPEKDRGRKAYIRFGAVDESCWVYVNGKLAASFTYDPVKNPDSWEQPLELPLGHALRFGAPNTLAVRVHDSEGAGGIWRGASLLFRD